jgi:hypothetical protein
MLVGAPFKITPQPSQFNHAKSNINIIFSSPVIEQKKKNFAKIQLFAFLNFHTNQAEGKKGT